MFQLEMAKYDEVISCWLLLLLRFTMARLRKFPSRGEIARKSVSSTGGHAPQTAMFPIPNTSDIKLST